MAAEENRPSDEVLRTKIEQRAHEIWKSEGSPHGCDVDHWLRAEAEIMSLQCTTSTPGLESQSTPAKGKDK